MNVGVFLEDFSPDVGGGYTIQADVFQSLLELAGESRHTFTIFCRRPEEIQAQLKSNHIRAVAFPGKTVERLTSKVARGLNAFREKRKLSNRLEQLAREAAVEFMWFVGAEAIQIDIPYMAIVWDLQHRLQPWFPEVSEHGVWEQRETFYATFLRRASVIIAGTEAGRAEIERFYQVTPERIKILPHPTPRYLQDLTPQDEKQVLKKYNLSEKYLFYPAQFWPHKNHANLLLALQTLRDKYQLSLHAAFAGSDKGNMAYIKRLADKLKLTEQVHFLGFVPQQDLIALYRNAFALAYVTFFGPENLPPLEAFKLGCPVVASKVSGAEEQLGDAALLVDPAEPEEMARVIKSLQTDAELRQTLIERGAARASLWTGEDFVKGVFSTLDEFERVRRTWDK